MRIVQNSHYFIPVFACEKNEHDQQRVNQIAEVIARKIAFFVQQVAEEVSFAYQRVNEHIKENKRG